MTQVLFPYLYGIFIRKKPNETGQHIKANRLERLQLLIDENGNPQVLYSAAALINVNERRDGTSFNVHIPLQVKTSTALHL